MPPFRPRAVRLEHSVDLIQYDAQQHRQTRRESEEAAEEAATAIARLIADTDSFLWRLCCVSALRSITRDLLFRRWCWDDSRTVASSFD